MVNQHSNQIETSSQILIGKINMILVIGLQDHRVMILMTGMIGMTMNNWADKVVHTKECREIFLEVDLVICQEVGPEICLEVDQEVYQETGLILKEEYQVVCLEVGTIWKEELGKATKGNSLEKCLEKDMICKEELRNLFREVCQEVGMICKKTNMN